MCGMYVCMYVCMCGMYVCIVVCMYVFMYVCMYVQSWSSYKKPLRASQANYLGMDGYSGRGLMLSYDDDDGGGDVGR